MHDGAAAEDRYGSRALSPTRTVERARHAGPGSGIRAGGPPGQHRPGQHRPGEHRPSEHRPSEYRAGEHRPGEHRPGQHRSGQHRRTRGRNHAAAGGKQVSIWRELLIIVVAAAALTLVVKAFVVQVFRIPSVSMQNTLQVGDRVLVNRLIYHFRPIARGDVIVFSGQDSWGPDAPPGPGDPVLRLFDDVLSDIGLHSGQTYYIKRVIGLPGDRVACCTDGKVTVNGVQLDESSYLYPGDEPSAFRFSVVVPPGHLWVMGDHRSDSGDSRYHLADPGGGAIPISEVVGRAFVVIWPPSQIRDLPIPSTFDQAALHGGAAGAAVLQTGGAAVRAGETALAAVAAFPVPATAGAAGIIATPLLRRRRRRRA
jgi:signal peptidase I